MKKLMLMAAAGLMLGACAKDNGRSGQDNVQQAAREPALQGKIFWGACDTRPGIAVATGILTGDAIKASRTAYGFDGAQVTRFTRFYQAADCSGDSAFTFRELGNMNIMENSKTQDGATFVDFNYDKLMLKIDSEAGVTVANGVKLCQTGDWAMGNDRDITGAAQDINCYAAQEPRLERNVYIVESANLFLGAQGPGTMSSEGRPTALDRVNQKFIAQ